MIEKAIEELEYLSQDDKTRQLNEEQLKAEFDFTIQESMPPLEMGKLRGKRKEDKKEDWKANRKEYWRVKC